MRATKEQIAADKAKIFGATHVRIDPNNWRLKTEYEKELENCLEKELERFRSLNMLIGIKDNEIRVLKARRFIESICFFIILILIAAASFSFGKDWGAREVTTLSNPQ